MQVVLISFAGRDCCDASAPRMGQSARRIIAAKENRE
jgi:hypothetical protein